MIYAPWEDDENDDGLAWIKSGVIDAVSEKEHWLTDGRPCASWFPRNLVLDLDPRHGKRLGNAIPNTQGWLVVDEKIRAAIDVTAPAGAVEYLPVKIRDLKRQLVVRPYWIANVLTVVDCVDMQRSKYRMGHIRKHLVSRFTELVLDESKIPKDAAIFRLANRPSLVVVREDLGEALMVKPFTGLAFHAISDFGSEFRPDPEEEEDES